MPEFELNYHAAPQAYYYLSDFARGYVEAMFFTNGDMGSETHRSFQTAAGFTTSNEALTHRQLGCACTGGQAMSPFESWLEEFDRECGELLRLVGHTLYVAAWRCYRDGLTPAEAVIYIAQVKGEC